MKANNLATHNRGSRSEAISVAIASGVLMSLSLAPLFLGSFAVFVGPVSQEFGWGSSVYPRSLVIGALACALGGPFAGRLLDRYGVRPFMLAGTAGFGLCLLSLSVAHNEIVILYLLPALIGLFSAVSGPICYAKVLSGWFDRPGFVLGAVLAAAPGFATAGVVVLTRWLVDVYGWRIGYAALGAIVLVVGLPIAALFVREASQVDGSKSSHSAAPGARVGMTMPQALRTLDFWLVVAVTCLTCGAINGVISEFIVWSNERSLQPGIATAALSIFYLLGPLGPIAAGFIADRTAGPKVLAIFYGLGILGLALVQSAGPAFIPFGTAILGFSMSTAVGLLPFYSVRYFGLRSSSEIFGLMSGLMALSMGGGPALLGWSHDVTGNFDLGVNGAFFALAGAMILGLLLRAYRYERADAVDIGPDTAPEKIAPAV